MNPYVIDVSVPARRPQRSPVTALLRPNVGVVVRGSIYFPDGCSGLVGVRLLDRGAQFAPSPGDNLVWIRGNAETITWEDDTRLDGPPYEIVVEAYNLADDWPHKVQIRLTIMPRSLDGAIGDLTDALRSTRRGR